jgi:hypothetical protein
MDPDLHLSKSLDPDPHIMNADPKHCVKLLLNFLSVKEKFLKNLGSKSLQHFFCIVDELYLYSRF